MAFLPSRVHPEFMMTEYLPALIWSLLKKVKTK